jgi:hypothetical protein
LTFTLNGERKFFRGALPIPPVILLNGELAALTDTVRAGDHLQFVPAKAGEDAVRRVSDVLGEDFTGTVTINGAKAKMDALIQTGDDIWADRKDTFSVPVEEAPAPKPAAPATPATSAPATPDASAGEAKQIRVTLNGEKLMLFGKPSGDPYFLMDLLKFSDLDFQNLDKPVELRVNGAPGQFQEVIKDGDSVEIA